MFLKNKRWRSKRWTDAAKGQPCTMRLVGVCNYDPETTVFAHANGAGVGMKSDDFMGCDCCSACHDCLDGRVKTELTQQEIGEAFGRAVFATIKNRLERKIFR